MLFDTIKEKMKRYQELIIHAAEQKYRGCVGSELRTAVKELEQLRTMALRFRRRGVEELEPDLRQLFTTSEFFVDFQWYVDEVLKESTPEIVIDSLKMVEINGSSLLYVGREQHWLLQLSRNVGLLKLSALRRLKTLKIKAVGSSVAAATLELLVDLGCLNIEVVDDGEIEPSNIPRLPMGDISTLGKSKCEVLVERLHSRSPFGKFLAVRGRVIATELDRNQSSDILIDDFVQGADLLIEVIDDIRIKCILHTDTLCKHPTLPLLFIADLGTRPQVCVVRHSEGKPFGRDWNVRETALLNQAKSSPTPPNVQQAAYLMVKEALPAQHFLQFVLSTNDIMPYWAQTPISSRLSAAQAALAVLNYCGGSTYTDVDEKETVRICQEALDL